MLLVSLGFLFLDIECVKMNGQGFPEAQDDPVIQISSIVEEQRQNGSNNHNNAADSPDEPLCRVIFTLHECAPIAGALVVWFDDESEMLRKWAEFVREVRRKCDEEPSPTSTALSDRSLEENLSPSIKMRREWDARSLFSISVPRGCSNQEYTFLDFVLS